MIAQIELCDSCGVQVGPNAIDNLIDKKVQCRKCFFKQYPELEFKQPTEEWLQAHNVRLVDDRYVWL
jgi:hypothetical protein